MQFGSFLTICRQEATARKSLIQMINSRDKPDGYEEVWENMLKGCVEWNAQELLGKSEEFEAIGIIRNSNITPERY